MYQPPAPPTTEAVTTEASFNGDFDYLTGLVEVNIPGNDEQNPFYTNATEYWPLNKEALTALDGTDTLGVASFEQSARGDKGWYYFLSSDKAYVKVGKRCQSKVCYVFDDFFRSARFLSPVQVHNNEIRCFMYEQVTDGLVVREGVSVT